MSFVRIGVLSRRWLCGLAVVAALVSSSAQRATAQEPLGPEYLSSKACAVFVVRAGDIRTAPETELWPWEIAQALSQQMLNIDSEHIAEIMLQVETPPPSRGGPPNPEIAAVIRFTEAYDLEEVLPMLQGGLEDGEINGSPARFAPQDGQPSLYMPDEYTLVVGGGPMLRRIAKLEDPGTKLSEMYAAMGSDDNAMMVVDIEALRPLLADLREMGPPPEQLPPPLAGLFDAPELLDGLMVSVNITGDCQCQLTMQATDAAAAEEMNQRMSDAIEFAAQMTLAQTRDSFSDDSAQSQAWVAYAERMVPEVFAKWQPEVAGDQLVLKYTLSPAERLAIRFGVAGALGLLRAEQSSEAIYYGEERAYEEPGFEDEFDYGEEAFEDHGDEEIFEDTGEAFEDPGDFDDAPFPGESVEEGVMEEEDDFEFSP